MKNEMIGVSVVIPVFNVAPYVEKCLNSVFQQTYPQIEVVVVDDCGTDNSMEIVRNFLASHPSFCCRIVEHPFNKGLSAARNTGLLAAQGDYVFFLDSDDFLPQDAIEKLVKPLEEYPFDMVLGNYKVLSSEPLTMRSELLIPDGVIRGTEAILSAYAAGLWYVMAWNKLCNRKFLLRENLTFTEGLLHEDVIWTFKLACKLQNMFVVKHCTYYYLIRQASIMTSMSYERDVAVYLRAFDEIIRFLQTENRLNGKEEYRIIEGKKSGILYSLLQIRETALYQKVYPAFHRQCYLSPFKAFRKRIISFPYFLRDLHYCLPCKWGMIYKKWFYQLVYAARGKRIEGALWN